MELLIKYNSLYLQFLDFNLNKADNDLKSFLKQQTLPLKLTKKSSL